MFLKRKNKEQEIKQTVLAKRRSSLVSKASISILLISTLSFNIAFANEDDSNTLKEIYHIYSDGKYVGALSDQTEMEIMMNQKVEDLRSQYKDFSLKAGSNLSIVPEQVFTASTNDEATLQKLDELIEVNAKAFALSVNDEMAVYVKDLDAYQEAVHKLKLHFVSEEELKALETRKDSTEALPELKENETRIAELILKEKVSGVTVEINPEKVVSPTMQLNFF